MTPESLAEAAGIDWFDYQLDALRGVQADTATATRACLYFKTGAGKSLTALACVRLRGCESALVVAPPSTHLSWEEAGRLLGVEVACMSHAKFRMKDTKLDRDKAVIADEMHMFGGHGGQGWKKLERLGRGLKAPLIMASATPNYNDADRVYCIQRILDPASCTGGFLQFVYQNCRTEQNPFGMTPIVTGFLHHADAAEYLSSLPGVYYLPDDLVYSIIDLPYRERMSSEYEQFGYNERKHRLVASIIEDTHTRRYQGLVQSNGQLQSEVLGLLDFVVNQTEAPWLIFANHSTVAEAISETLHNVSHGLVTGKTSKKEKDDTLESFKKGHLDVLIGTASLATGTDGLDKVCNNLIIVDDTDDGSLRRQLIGRIMPRGQDTDASMKKVYRLVPS